MRMCLSPFPPDEGHSAARHTCARTCPRACRDSAGCRMKERWTVRRASRQTDSDRLLESGAEVEGKRPSARRVEAAYGVELEDHSRCIQTSACSQAPQERG